MPSVYERSSINWSYLSKAIEFYGKRYQLVDVPWKVRDEVHFLTCPDVSRVIKSDIGSLVGSSEQSFIQMSLDKMITPGRWMACTPCFRNEEEDKFHQKYFMKVELFDSLSPNLETLKYMVHDAYKFFSLFSRRVSIVDTGPCSWDIFINDIEVGSYGYREVGDLRWLYGTGVAEPRLSLSLGV